MGDMGDYYRDRRDATKDRHARWHDENMKVMESSGIPFEVKNYGESVMTVKKAVFYPSTGRWVYKGKRGGAKAFVEWYKKLEG